MMAQPVLDDYCSYFQTSSSTLNDLVRNRWAHAGRIPLS